MRGPAGIGKTALLAEARALATVPVYSATGSELERSFPFGAVQQLLGAVLGEPTQAVLHELYWLVADRCPAVLLVDDAHWVDRASLRWLAYMVNRVADLPLAILLAARDGEPDELLSPDRAALGDDRARAAPAVRSGRGRAGRRRRRVRGHRRQPVLCPRGDRRHAALGGRVRGPAAGGAAAGMHRAGAGAVGGERDGRGARRRARRGVGGRRRSRRSRAPTSCAATTSPTRSCARRCTPRSRRPRSAGLHLAAARLLDDPERVAAQLMAAGPGGGVVGRRGAARRRPRGMGARRARGRGGVPDAAPPRRRCRARSSSACCASSPARGSRPPGRTACRCSARRSRWPRATSAAEIALELGRSLFSQGYFADACAAFEAGGGEAELATVAVLDLSLVRRFGGLDAIAERAPDRGPAPGSRSRARRTPTAPRMPRPRSPTRTSIPAASPPGSSR